MSGVSESRLARAPATHTRALLLPLFMIDDSEPHRCLMNIILASLLPRQLFEQYQVRSVGENSKKSGNLGKRDSVRFPQLLE
jgi:hypothetical protein